MDFDFGFNLKDFRVIPMTEAVSKNSDYFGISMKLALALDKGKISTDVVSRALVAGIDPDTMIPAEVAVAPVVLNIAPVSEVAPSAPEGIVTNPTREAVEAMSIISLKEYAKSIGIDVKSRDPKSDIVDMVMQRFEVTASKEEPAKE